MNRSDLLVTLASKLNSPKTSVDTVLRTLVDTVLESLKDGDDVHFLGLGRFYVKDVPPRVRKDPFNPARIISLPRRKRLVFKVAPKITRGLNGK